MNLHFDPATAWAVFSSIITLAAGAAAAAPPPQPGTKWAVVRGVIDVLAVNFGNAKNASPK
jgi:hypothetical protein